MKINTKKHIKVICSFVIAAVAILLFVLVFGMPTAIPVSNAEFEIDNRVLLKYCITDNTAIERSLDYYLLPVNCKKVIIPEGVTTIASNAFANNNRVSSITIPKSVTTIEAKAFIDCSRLERIDVDPDNKKFTSIDGILYNKDKTELIYFPIQNKLHDLDFFGVKPNLNLPDTVKTIREYAIGGGLESLTIPKGLNKIEDNAFGSKYLNIKVDPRNKNFIVDGKVLFNKDNTKIIHYMEFADDGTDNGYRIPMDETDSYYSIPNGVTTICGSAFTGCSFTKITIPDSVKEIGDRAFYNCNHLTNINIPNSVETIGEGAFSGCTELTKVVLPNSIKTISESAFSNCSKLTEIVIPDSVKTISENAFSKCSELTKITLPNSIETIGKSAFSDCSMLAKFFIPYSVKEIGDMPFVNCLSLTEINVDTKNKNFTTQDGVLFNKDLTEIISCPMGRKDKNYVIPESVNKIYGAAFSNCFILVSVKIPNGVKYIGDSAFKNCENLLNITIPDSVTYIGDNAFNGCTNLTGITLPDKITEIGEYTFSQCCALKDLEMPDSIKKIGNGAFSNCEQIEKIVIPNGVESIGTYAFYMCKNLATIYISQNVSIIGNYAFFGCRRLTNIDIPDKITSIGCGIDWNCTNLTRFTVSPKNKNYTVKDGVLFDKDMTRLISYPQCKKDSDYVIPDSVTTIGEAAFESSKNLKRIKIPSGLKTIEEYAFMNCQSLEKFDIPDSVNVAKYALWGSLQEVSQ